MKLHHYQMLDAIRALDSDTILRLFCEQFELTMPTTNINVQYRRPGTKDSADLILGRFVYGFQPERGFNSIDLEGIAPFLYLYVETVGAGPQGDKAS